MKRSWWAHMSDSALAAAHLPLWIKVLYTMFVCALIPIYWVQYGAKNFLWFSDIALLASVAALWLENSLLASMMAVAVVAPELAWNVDFFGRLIFGRGIGGLSGYMFDPKRPLYLRGLSLFHIVLPVLLVWIVHRLGYDRRAWLAQTLLACIVLPITYLLTKPGDNINWVFGPLSHPQQRLPPLLYLGLVMIIFPVAIYLPTHWVLLKLFGRP